MNILAAPISGGCFGIQLAAIKKLCEIGYRPDICFVGSGGTVACLVAEAGNWKPSGIDMVVSELDSKVFIKKKCKALFNVIPSDVVGYFSGYMYESNPTPEVFMKNFFTSKSVQETEIWIGAINKRSGRLATFCNKSYEKSIIKGDNFNTSMYNSEPLRYLSGDIVNISRAMIASCSIPILLNSRDIGEESYIDCGTKFASPLTSMQEEIKHLSVNSVHIIYVSGYDVQRSLGVIDNNKTSTMSGLFETIPNHIVRGMVIADRSAAYQIISSTTTLNNPVMYAIAPISSLKEIILERSKCQASLIEIYPVTSIEVNIFDFTSKDLAENIAISGDLLGIRLWWSCKIGDKNRGRLFKSVPNIMMTRASSI